jgi:hypothetical protein
MYRNPKLLKAVATIPCQNCGLDDGTTVAAHSNQLRDGKGRGLKAHDYRVATLCFKCHAELDQGNTWSKAERIEMWESAYRSTIAELFERHLIVVK